MPIRVTNIGKINPNTQKWEVSKDVTNQEIIDDEFYSILKQETSFENDETSMTYQYYACIDQTIIHEALYDFITTNLGCPLQLSAQFSDTFKFSQRFYRYCNEDFTYLCPDIFQDLIKIGVSIKGYAPTCEIQGIESMVLIDLVADYIKSILGADTPPVLDKMIDATGYTMDDANLEVGVVNEAFTKYSQSTEAILKPTTYKQLLDDDTVHDISLSITFDGRMMYGNITVKQKVIKIYDKGVAV